MRLRMLKHCVGKGRHVMKQLHVCLIVLQYDAIVATERAGYVLYRALVHDKFSCQTIFEQTILYRIIVNIAYVFRAFNFCASQAVRKYFNNEIFAIYGSSSVIIHFHHRLR